MTECRCGACRRPRTAVRTSGRNGRACVELAQLVAGPVQPHLYGSLRDSEPAGDCRLGQILLVAQLQQLAVALAQGRHRRMQVGQLDRGQHLLVFLSLAELDRRRQVRPHPRVLAEGLVADDRRQPLVASVGVAQGRAPTPGSEQGILSYVFGFARIARVAIGQSKTDPLCLTPLPAVVVPVTMLNRSVDATNLHRNSCLNCWNYPDLARTAEGGR